MKHAWLAGPFLVAVAALATCLSGCDVDPSRGYTFASPYRQNVRTVAVETFDRGRDIYRREIEFRATEAVKKRINQASDYVVCDRARADSLLTGKLEVIEQRVLSYNPDTGRPREQEITLTVSFRWQDLRTGDIIKERKNFRVTGTYVQDEPISEDFSLGRELVLNRLARRIVEEMEADW